MSNRAVDHFSEIEYLRHNPDVEVASQKGQVPSGWYHFVQHGYREKRPGVPRKIPAPIRLVLETASVVIPPAHLMDRVSGSSSPATFNIAGKIIALDLLAALRSDGWELPAKPRILDFGSGCGRVTPWMALLFPDASLHGCDIDGEAVDWCNQNLGNVAEFHHTATLPPLPFADASFDFIYSISIFTHLPEEMQLAWLAELNRITKPTGVIAATVLNVSRMKDRTATDERKGFHYVPSGHKVDLPSFYQSTFHSEGYVNKYWSEHVGVTRIIRHGCNNHQDIVLCRPRPLCTSRLGPI